MSDVFPTVSFFKRGYDPASVDRFFDTAREAYEGGVPAREFSASNVHRAIFPLKYRGYDPAVVDAALDRLEAAFVSRDRADHVAVNGEEAWLSHVANRAANSLYPRLTRPEGERFAHPAKGVVGYRIAEVDAFCDRLIRYFDEQEMIRVDEVRALTFPPAKGEDAYSEGIVDAYLARVIEILLSVE